jgi:hypothetical protein
MTNDEALAAVKAAFGDRPIKVTIARGVMKIESATHFATCAISIEAVDGVSYDDFIRDVMLPESAKTMDRMIDSGEAPKREAA